MDVALQPLAGRTILVTGANGFLGSRIVRQLGWVPCTIRRLHRSSGPASPLPESAVAKIEDIAGDVRELQTWMELMGGVDVVLHLAGQTSVYAAARDPGADLKANVIPVLNLLEACRTLRTHPAVVFAGTATQVGMTATSDPIDESHSDRPITVYDVHKLMAEQYLEIHAREGIFAATTLRLANVYGPGPQGSSGDRGFLNAMVRRALAGEALQVYGAGDAVRDYIYVDDVARAFLVAATSIQSGHSLSGRHFVIGSGCGTTIAEALQLVSRRVAIQTGIAVPVISVDPPQGLSPIEQRSFVANTAEFRLAAHWTAQVSLEEGMDRTIRSLC